MRLLAILLLGLALRLFRLNSLGDLEFDEIVSVRYASLPPEQLLPTLAGALFEHPPLFYLALGWWRSLAGESDLLARLFSVFPGTATIALAYVTGRRLFSRLTGEAAALLIAIAPLPIFYSREVRMYALVACLILAAVWLFLRAAGRPRGLVHWVTFGLIIGIAAAVHYAGALATLSLLASAILLRGRGLLRPMVLALSAVAAFGVPWLMVSSGTRHSIPALDPTNLNGVPVALWRVWLEMTAGPDATGALAAVAGIALLALATVGFPRAHEARMTIGAILLGGLVTVLVPLALGKPVQPRYLLPVTALVYICAGHALVRLAGWNRRGTAQSDFRQGEESVLHGWEKRMLRSAQHDNLRIDVLSSSTSLPWRGFLAATAVLVGIVPFGVRYYGQYQRADYSQITRRIEELQRPGDAVLLTGPWQAWYFDYYYRRDLPHHVLPQTAPPAVTPAEAQQKLMELEATRRRLWFVQAGLAQADPSGIVEHWLQRNAWPAMRLAHHNAVLSLYALHPPEHTQSLRPIDFGGLVRLSSGWVDRDEVPAGEVARLSLSFQVLEATPVNYKASLRLVGADGQRIATDFDLLDYASESPVPTAAWRPGETITLQRGIWLPPSANPQPYSVRLVVYDPATLQPLRPDAAAGGTEINAGPAGEALLGGLYVTQSRASLQPDLAYAAVGRQFGGGDDFDTFVLKGYRWHQANPSTGPLQFDLLWQLWGKSGTTHLSRLEIVDDAGRMWVEEARPLFGGAFATHDWREGEILGERRALDVTTLPAGHYRLRVRLHDIRGQLLPLAAPSGAAARSVPTNAEATTAVEIGEFTLPYRRPLLERVRGALTRVQGLWR